MESRSIDLISKKKNKLHVQHTYFSNQQIKKQICTCSTLFVFLCRCFTQLQRCFVGLKRQNSWLHIIFIEEFQYVLTQFCLLRSCSLLFFTAPHFHLAGRSLLTASISHRLTAALNSVFLPTKFGSSSFSVIHVNVNIKNNVEKDTTFFLKVRAAMRFLSK